MSTPGFCCRSVWGNRVGRALVVGCVTVVLVLAGCDGRPASQSRWWGERYEQVNSGQASRMHIQDMLDTWVGAHGQDLMDAWGDPNKAQRRPNGEWWLYYYPVESYDEHGPGLFLVWFLSDRRGVIYAYEWDAYDY